MKSQYIGILLIVGGFAAMIWQSMEETKARQAQMEAQQEEAQAVPLAVTTASKEATPELLQPTEEGETQAPLTASYDALLKKSSRKSEELFPESSSSSTPEETYTLENDFIRVTFTNHGGAIKRVELIGRDVNGKLIYPETLEGEEPYTFNKHNPHSALELVWGEIATMPTIPNPPVYELVGKKGQLIQFRHLTSAGVEIIRGYKLAETASSPETQDGKEPYIIRHETSFRNPTTDSFDFSRIYVNLGALPPTEGDNLGQFLNVVYYDGFAQDDERISSSEFSSRSGFMGIGAHTALPYMIFPNTEENAPLQINWSCVKNQFFTGIAMPSEPGASIYARGYNIGKDLAGKPRIAITGYMGFDLGQLEAGGKRILGIDYYAGPKEYERLAALGKEKEALMQFGWGPIGFIGKILLAALGGLHSLLVHASPQWAWGWAIITLTVIVKMLLFPLTAVQIRSSKKMQVIQEPMKAIREKYQNDPQRLQTEMMKLFKENRINPAAGCLPMLVQIPIFIGLFYMLQTASQLRFGSFMWVEDLAVPDTVSWLPVLPHDIWLIGGPIHILPILMCVSMYFQMRMMPTPTTDNAQVKILRFMPFIFFPITYSFPSGVTLYWTMSNLLTILQTYLTRDMRAAPAEATPAPTTPKGKKKNKRNA